MQNNTDDTDTANEFSWPDMPPRDWWEATGASYGLDDGQIRFAASLYAMGGIDARKNSAAAKAAGLPLDRTQSYRLARSVSIKRLLDDAAALKQRKRPLSTAEVEQIIDAKIVKLLEMPDAQSFKIGVELYERRKAAQKAQLSDDAYEADGLLGWRLERDSSVGFRNGATSYILVHGIHNLHLLHDTHFLVMREEFGPEIWSRLYAKLNEDSRAWLDKHLADPSYQLEVRKEVWAEIGRKPPGLVDANAVDWRVKGLPNPAEKAEQHSGNGAVHAAN